MQQVQLELTSDAGVPYAVASPSVSPGAPLSPRAAPAPAVMQQQQLQLPALIHLPSVVQADAIAWQDHQRNSAELYAQTRGAIAEHQACIAEQQLAVVSNLPSYEHLVSHVLQDNETVLAVLPIAGVELRNAEKDGPVLLKPGGHVLLTARRVILLCSSSLFTLDKTWQGGAPKSLQGQYVLNTTLSAAVWYFPLPLENCRHLSLDAGSKVSASSTVVPTKPCCVCCCAEQWSRSRVAPALSNTQQTLYLGATLPPWNKPTDISIQVLPSTPLLQVQQFIRAFEQLLVANANKIQAQQNTVLVAQAPTAIAMV